MRAAAAKYGWGPVYGPSGGEVDSGGSRPRTPRTPRPEAADGVSPIELLERPPLSPRPKLGARRSIFTPEGELSALGRPVNQPRMHESPRGRDGTPVDYAFGNMPETATSGVAATPKGGLLNLKPFSAERKKLQLAKDIQMYASAGQQRKMQAESIAEGYKEKTDKLHSLDLSKRDLQRMRGAPNSRMASAAQAHASPVLSSVTAAELAEHSALMKLKRAERKEKEKEEKAAKEEARKKKVRAAFRRQAQLVAAAKRFELAFKVRKSVVVQKLKKAASGPGEFSSAKAIFEFFDADQDGILTEEDFTNMLKSAGGAQSTAQTFKQIAPDGRMTFNLFERYYSGEGQKETRSNLEQRLENEERLKKERVRAAAKREGAIARMRTIARRHFTPTDPRELARTALQAWRELVSGPKKVKIVTPEENEPGPEEEEKVTPEENEPGPDEEEKVTPEENEPGPEEEENS